MFVAVWPSAEIARGLAAIERPARPGVRWVPEQNWHITLRFIGEADAGQVADRLADADLRGATARLAAGPELLGRRQFVIPVDGVDELARTVRSATNGIGETDRFGFRGHLTLARLNPNVAVPEQVAGLDADFDVVEIALVTSELHPDAPIYTTIARFPTR